MWIPSSRRHVHCRKRLAWPKLPIFFTTWDFDPSMPPSPHDAKVRMAVKQRDEKFISVGSGAGAPVRRTDHRQAVRLQLQRHELIA
jgi:hypothetical protein